MADINKSIELNPSFGDNYKIRAMLYEEMNESAKAQSDRQKYAELSEN